MIRGNRLAEERDRRRGFARAAATYDVHARIPDEIRGRLLEHLDPVRIAPSRILDAGSGTGRSTRELARRYRAATVFGLDFALAALQAAKGPLPRIFRRQQYVCGAAQAIPFDDGSFGLVCSNLAPAAFLDTGRWMGEIARVLAPGGMVCFSTLGPDTLFELRDSWAEVDPGPHVHDFLDMHDIGDALVRSGFTDVVMDAERLTVEYPEFPAILRELRALGAGNTAPARRRGLTTPREIGRVAMGYESARRKGKLPVTLEIVYAHAWKRDHEGGSVSVAAPARVR